MIIDIEVNPRFENYIFDWSYETYLLVGGYGSSKSYNTALKIVLKLLKQKRKCLVIRETFESIKESCYDLFYEILNNMGILDHSKKRGASSNVKYKESPLEFVFPNGSRIIFKGMDKPGKLKSINGISIVWLEEGSEIKYSGYKELLGRLRTLGLKAYFFITTNPVEKNNWIYHHFFKREDEQGNFKTIVDDEILYVQKTLVKNNVYYHHSIPEDNLFLPKSYLRRLEEMADYDPDLYRVAKLGRFGTNGRKVLPNFCVAASHNVMMKEVNKIKSNLHFTGMDFGFETSYNAVVKCAVDEKNQYLYIYWEYYKRQITDVKVAKELEAEGLQDVLIIADSADPEAIRFFNDSGFYMRPCTKWAGSRLANTKKMRRFKKIICSPYCINAIKELKHLVYKIDSKGNLIFDQFNIDPHIMSALWYALDLYNVADLKYKKTNSKE